MYCAINPRQPDHISIHLDPIPFWYGNSTLRSPTLASIRLQKSSIACEERNIPDKKILSLSSSSCVPTVLVAKKNCSILYSLQPDRIRNMGSTSWAAYGHWRGSGSRLIFMPCLWHLLGVVELCRLLGGRWWQDVRS